MTRAQLPPTQAARMGMGEREESDLHATSKSSHVLCCAIQTRLYDSVTLRILAVLAHSRRGAECIASYLDGRAIARLSEVVLGSSGRTAGFA